MIGVCKLGNFAHWTNTAPSFWTKFLSLIDCSSCRRFGNYILTYLTSAPFLSFAFNYHFVNLIVILICVTTDLYSEELFRGRFHYNVFFCVQCAYDSCDDVTLYFARCRTISVASWKYLLMSTKYSPMQLLGLLFFTHTLLLPRQNWRVEVIKLGLWQLSAKVKPDYCKKNKILSVQRQNSAKKVGILLTLFEINSRKLMPVSSLLFLIIWAAHH